MRKLVSAISCVGALLVMVLGPERAEAGSFTPLQAAPTATGVSLAGATTAGLRSTGSAGEKREGGRTLHVVSALEAAASATASTAGTSLSSTTPRLTFTTPDGDAFASTRCPAGMVEVEGDYCPNVEQKCLRWLDPDTQMRCAEFAPSADCTSKTVHKHFCIDKYEYPNRAGERPAIMKTWYEARDACQAQGKRLCGDSEWTLACEGQERLPYPYGFARDAEACNIDKPHPDVNEAAIANPKTRDAEVARLWQGEPSGTRDACVSPFGAHDMTGNVDEWVVNEKGVPYKSGLKGGYWGPVRTRCRPMTTVHNEDFMFYQIGFRCCGEPTDQENFDMPGLEQGPRGTPAATGAPPAPVLGS